MAIPINCDRCGLHYAAPVTAGASYPCPRCGQKQRLPGGGEPRRGGLRRAGRMGRPGFRARAPVQDEGYEDDMEEAPRPSLGRPRLGGFRPRPAGLGRPRTALGARSLAGPGLRRRPRPPRDDEGNENDAGGGDEEGYEGDAPPPRVAATSKKNNKLLLICGGGGVAVILLVVLFSLGNSARKSHEAVVQDVIGCINELAAVVEGIRDGASAKAAGPRIDAIATRVKALKRREESLPRPSRAAQRYLEDKFGGALEQAGLRLVAASQRLGILAASNPEVQAQLDRIQSSLQGFESP